LTGCNDIGSFFDTKCPPCIWKLNIRKVYVKLNRPIGQPASAAVEFFFLWWTNIYSASLAF